MISMENTCPVQCFLTLNFRSLRSKALGLGLSQLLRNSHVWPLALWWVIFQDEHQKVKWSEFAQSCPTLCDPMDCSLPGFSVHGIFQARVLEWVAISFSRGSSWPRDWTQVSYIAGRYFTLWATREAHPSYGARRRHSINTCWMNKQMNE